MSDTTAPSIGQDAAAWIRSGPSEAPEGLLSTIVGRSRRTPQRSAWIAWIAESRTIGLTTAAASTSRHIPIGRRVLLVVIALVVLAAGAWIVGATRQRPVVVVPLPSTVSPSPDATARETSVPRGTAPPVIVPARQETVFAADLTFTVAGDAQLSTTDSRVTVISSALEVLVERWVVGDPHVIDRLGAEPIVGDSAAAIARSVAEHLGGSALTPPLSRWAKSLDGHPGYEWTISPEVGIAPRPQPFSVDLLVDGRTAYAFAAFARNPETATLARVEYASLIGSADVLTPYDITVLDGQLAFTVPGSYQVSSTETNVGIQQGNPFLGFGRGLRIVASPLGKPLDLGPLTANGRASTILTGTSLKALAASLHGSWPSTFGPPTLVSVGASSERGYRWTYVVGVFIEPIRSDLTLVIHENVAYAFIGSMDPLTNLHFLR